ncbi:MAG: hypothetical protein QXD77_01785 [Candidatus Aenigmatarchaeota archaeon]
MPYDDILKELNGFTGKHKEMEFTRSTPKEMLHITQNTGVTSERYPDMHGSA